MKKAVSAIFFLIFMSSLFAQQISVKTFRKLETDLDARVNEPLKDQNGDLCAIIKVQTTQSGFYFDGGQLGIIKTITKHGEIWVYVPWGLKRLTISHDKLGVLRDYPLNTPIEKATVYELVLTTGKVITTVDETIESQWLVINPEPAEASVYINEVFVKSGAHQTKLKPGIYTYRVEAPLYHTEAGKLEITDSKKEITVKLKPAFGYVTVNTEPEKDAKVFIDGKPLKSTTPCRSEALSSGEHTVQVIKDMYQPSSQKVSIIDGQTSPVSFNLQASFAEVKITAPAEAIVYVNNVKKATGTWSGRLSAGIHTIEARMDKHRPSKQDIEVAPGDSKTINLQPTPIYGSLDIVTTPMAALITINGKDYGTTPTTLNNLLIGEYSIRLSKVGYLSLDKSVIVGDGQGTTITEVLSAIGKTVTIHSYPLGAKLYIDNKEVGLTPYTGILSSGNHTLLATLDNLTKEQTLDFSQSGEDNYTLTLGRLVKIESTIENARIIIDNKEVGITPFKGFLSIGNHIVRIQNNEQSTDKNIVIEENGGETNFSIDAEIKIPLGLEKVSRTPGKTSAVLLSVLVPGLGDFNATNGKKIGIGKTLTSYGLIMAGIGSKLYSVGEYSQYLAATNQATMNTHYTNANYSNYAFYGLTAAGLAVWFLDILWVANKESQNKKDQMNNKISLMYDQSNQTVGMTYKISF